MLFMCIIKKAFLASIITILSFLCTIQSAAAQSSFYDSLRQVLTYFHTNAYGENLRIALERTQTLAKKDIISDSLATQLMELITQDMLLNDHRIVNTKVKHYGNFLVQVLHRLQQLESSNNTDLLDCLAQVYELTE